LDLTSRRTPPFPYTTLFRSNVVMNEHRTTGRRERRVATTENPEALERHVGGGHSSEGLSIDLERAIAELPDGAREVFVLYDVERSEEHTSELQSRVDLVCRL